MAASDATAAYRDGTKRVRTGVSGFAGVVGPEPRPVSERGFGFYLRFDFLRPQEPLVMRRGSDAVGIPTPSLLLNFFSY